MKIRFICSFILLSFISGFIYADTFKVNNIKVIGIQKVDEGVLLSSLPFEPGANFDTNKTSTYINAIYQTGFFKSITLNRSNNDVIIYVKEKPTIADIKIIGNDSFEQEKLDKALADIGIKDGGTYDEFTLERLTKELEQQYLSQGKYSVKIDTEVKALDRNRVDITINISEGRSAKIKQIRIIGNNSFSQQELTSNFTLTEGSLLSWVTFSDRYSKQKLSGDLEKLKSFYLDRGYLKFQINDARISITPDKKNVYIIIQVTEGDIFKVGQVSTGGRVKEYSKELKELITIKPGDVYSERDIGRIEKQILDELGRKGYLYAKVEINKDIKPSKKTVDITFFINSSKRVYVRRIVFEGNLRTQDEVLRRELLQMEGGFISREKIELSKLRLSQLGYIKDINVETIPVSSSDDQVDLYYTLTEASTGHFNGGVGYVEKEGFMFNLGISQENFLGSGKSVSANLNKSKAATNSSVSYFDPYFTIDGIGLGYNIFYNNTKLDEVSVSDYRLDVIGADASLRIPLTLFDLLSFNAGVQNKKVISSKNSPTIVQNFIAKYGKHYDLYTAGSAWTHSRLDRALFPTQGWKNQLSGNIMLPGSDLNYYMLYNSTKIYIPVHNEFILYLKGNIGYGAGYNSDSSLPFFENYFAGGAGSVRGFEQNSLGPRDSFKANRGGNALLTGSVELYLPKLFATNIAWRPSMFIDAGNVFDGNIHFNKLNMSAGIGLQWLSPMGPLSVSYALPIRKFHKDQLKSFNLNVGSIF